MVGWSVEGAPVDALSGRLGSGLHTPLQREHGSSRSTKKYINKSYSLTNASYFYGVTACVKIVEDVTALNNAHDPRSLSRSQRCCTLHAAPLPCICPAPCISSTNSSHLPNSRHHNQPSKPISHLHRCTPVYLPKRRPRGSPAHPHG